MVLSKISTVIFWLNHKRIKPLTRARRNHECKNCCQICPRKEEKKKKLSWWENGKATLVKNVQRFTETLCSFKGKPTRAGIRFYICLLFSQCQLDGTGGLTLALSHGNFTSAGRSHTVILYLTNTKPRWKAETIIGSSAVMILMMQLKTRACFFVRWRNR